MHAGPLSVESITAHIAMHACLQTASNVKLSFNETLMLTESGLLQLQYTAGQAGTSRFNGFTS